MDQITRIKEMFYKMTPNKASSTCYQYFFHILLRKMLPIEPECLDGASWQILTY